MAGSVVVEQQSVAVVPGQTGSCTVRIRNTGAVVDQFALTVLGQPSAWTTVVPATLSLFPNADGTIELHFAPPRAPGVGAGPTPFGVRVVGSEDPDNPVVEEGEVDLLPFVDVTAKLTPRSVETKRKSKHDIVLDNKGNSPVAVRLSASDPDEQLAFDLKDDSVTVEAGQARHVPLKVAARKGFARGSDKHRPFQVVARPDGALHPLTMDGNLIQKAGLPRFVLPLIAGAVALALIAAVLPGMLNKDGGGGGIIGDLAGSNEPATTVAPADTGAEEEDPNAPATPEEAAAAAAAELAANGQDGSAGSTGAGTGSDAGTGGSTGAASGGSGTAAGSGSTGGNTSDGSTAVTSPSATTAPAPTSSGGGTTATTTAGGTTATTAASGGSGTTTTPTTAASTTTAPQLRGKFAGAWATADSSSKMAISVGSSMSVSTGGAVGSWNCIGSVTDADDGSFTAGKCSDGGSRTITYLSSTDQVRVSGTDCGFSRCPIFTFNRN